MRGDKKDYVQLGTRIPKEDFQDLKSFYQGYGMQSKVVRVLINRHLVKLRARQAAAVQNLALGLDSEIITARELEEVEA